MDGGRRFACFPTRRPMRRVPHHRSAPRIVGTSGCLPHRAVSRPKWGSLLAPHFVILLVLLLISRSPHFGDVAPGPSTVRFVFAEPPTAPPLASERAQRGASGEPEIEPKSPAKPEPPTSLTPSPRILPHPPAGAPFRACCHPTRPQGLDTLGPADAKRAASGFGDAIARKSSSTSLSISTRIGRPTSATGWSSTAPRPRTRLRNVRGMVVNACPAWDGQVADVSVQRSSGNRGSTRRRWRWCAAPCLPPFPSHGAASAVASSCRIYDLE